jgi:hypothetical protein
MFNSIVNQLNDLLNYNSSNMILNYLILKSINENEISFNWLFLDMFVDSVKLHLNKL